MQIPLKELDADPHGVFRRYRKNHAIVLHETGGYFVLRFAEVNRLGKDPRLGPSGTSFPASLGISSGPVFDLFTYSMMTADGDAHRRRRAPLSRQFANRTINEMRKNIRRTADELINGWYGNGEVDFFGEFAASLPARVIADMLGLPREEIPEFTVQVYQVTNQGLDTGPDAKARRLPDRHLCHPRAVPVALGSTASTVEIRSAS